MLDRIKFSLCHPSRVGLFHKDKLGKVISYVAIFMVFLIAVVFLRGINTNYFEGDSKNITNMVLKYDGDININYKNGELTGNEVSILSNDYDLIFLSKKDRLRGGERLTLELNASSCKVYYDTDLIKDVSYKSFRAVEFNVDKLNNDDMILFHSFINTILLNCNKRLYTLDSITQALSYILSLIVVFLFNLLISFVTNPEITKDIRVRLCLYDSLIYIFITTLAIMLGIEFLELLALIIPIIYTKITFSHIIRVRIK